MPRRKRQVQLPNRRIAPLGSVSGAALANLHQARYVGSAHHKTRSADYDFNPPVNPRPAKSLCDELRTITLREAISLFRSGIKLGMVSNHQERGLPKFVWAVDHEGEPYEAILGSDGPNYHGYRLNRKAPNREYVIAEWNNRKRLL
jgi:hypothetical protein